MPELSPPTLLFVGCDEQVRMDLAFIPPECRDIARVDSLGDSWTFLLLTDPTDRYLVAYGPDVVEGFAATRSPRTNLTAGHGIALVHGDPTAAVRRGAASLGLPIVSLPRDWDVLLLRLGASPAAVSAAVQGGAA